LLALLRRPPALRLLLLAGDDALLKLLLEDHEIPDGPVPKALKDEIVDAIFYDSRDLDAEALVIDLNAEHAIGVLLDGLDLISADLLIPPEIVHLFFLGGITNKCNELS
jgi:hypothetical protein